MRRPALALALAAFCLLAASSARAFEPNEAQRAALDRIESLAAEAREKLGVPGLSVAVVRGQETVLAKGWGLADPEAGRPADAKSLYRIGSITKTFTATLLVLARDAGEARLDDPISLHLPEGARVPEPLPGGLREITLRHLATHCSGLPRVPGNLSGPAEDPYGGYPLEALWEGLASARLESPIGRQFSYSNLGAGLLGQLLARAAGKDYETLVRERLLEPLGMESSGFFGREEAGERWAAGHSGLFSASPVQAWDLGALGPAGALVSSAEDMAKFAALQLRAGEADSEVVAGGSLFELHAVQRLDGGGWKRGVGLGWIVQRDEAIGGDVVWHNGGTAGCRSWLGFAPGANVAVVVLANRDKSVDELGLKLLREAAAGLALEDVAVVPPDALEAAKRLAGFFEPEPAEKAEALFHPTFLAAIPAESLELMFLGLRGTTGPCLGVDVVPSDKAGVWLALLDTEKGGRLRVLFSTQPDASGAPKLAYCQILPAEPETE